MRVFTDSSSCHDSFSLVDALLHEQGCLSAVEQFAQQHENAARPLLGGHYQDLIPSRLPDAGEQYAFEVDLDACSGCKACVAACHSLNGLEPDEAWRRVGVLYGGDAERAYVQHVTTTCHHCIDPACLTGCPALAYEKDSITGVVKHLDDQCIGCQYCVFMCPYDVPMFRVGKGIVRKCDMCQDRLASGEAPACVQSCPHEAIRIRTVSKASITQQCESGQFLPTAPDPVVTLPTTTFRSRKPVPRNVLPADYYQASPQHAHMSLVFMLVLTQLSVGAFVISQVLIHGAWEDPVLRSEVRPYHAAAGALLGAVGVLAAVFHLGRPLQGWRAILGWRTSWLSREVIAFSVFVALAVAHAGCAWVAARSSKWDSVANYLGAAACAAGAVAVGCSIMIYARTGRPLWSLHRSSGRFLLTGAVLGLPVALLVSLIVGVLHPSLTVGFIMELYGEKLCVWLIALVAAKLVFEAAVYLEIGRRRLTPLKRSAIVLGRELGMSSVLRFFFGVMGGLVLPTMILLSRQHATPDGHSPPLFHFVIVLLVFATLLIGEVIERTLFFSAAAAARMPGGVAA